MHYEIILIYELQKVVVGDDMHYEIILIYKLQKVVVGDDIPKKSLPEEEEEEDPWKLSEVTVEVTPWRGMTFNE